MLSTLKDKVDPRHAALVLVDVQNDFCAEGGAMHREGRDLTLVKRMIPRLERLLEAARAAQDVLGRPLGSHVLTAGPVVWNG
jgi:ureidoacrylate peracid hydrolase